MYCPYGFYSEIEFDLLLRKYSSNFIFAGELIPTAQLGTCVRIFVYYVCDPEFMGVGLALAISDSIKFFALYIQICYWPHYLFSGHRNFVPASPLLRV